MSAKTETQKKIQYRSAEGWIADCVSRVHDKTNAARLVVNTDMQARSKWISGAYLAAEAIGGSVVGLAVALAGGIAAGRLLPRSDNGWDDLIYAILGAIIGYTIGVSLGVYVIGRWLNRRDGISTRRRAYWLALLGSVLGAALVLLAAEPLHLNSNTAVLQTFLIILPPIGATLGFNMRRRARR